MNEKINFIFLIIVVTTLETAFSMRKPFILESDQLTDEIWATASVTEPMYIGPSYNVRINPLGSYPVNQTLYYGAEHNSSDSSDDSKTSSDDERDEESDKLKRKRYGIWISEEIAKQLKNAFILSESNKTTFFGNYLLKSNNTLMRKLIKPFCNGKFGIVNSGYPGTEDDIPFDELLSIKNYVEEWGEILHSDSLRVKQERNLARKKIVGALGSLIAAPLLGLGLYYARFKENVPWIQYSKKSTAVLGAMGIFGYGVSKLYNGVVEWNRYNKRYTWLEKWKNKAQWLLGYIKILEPIFSEDQSDY